MEKNQKGVSLVELLLVIGAVVILVFLLGSLPASFNLISKSKHQSIAREIISKEVESLRATPYDNIATGQISIADSRIGLLPSGSASRLIEDCDPTVCTQDENTKKVTITIIWNESGKEQNEELVTLMSERGLNQ
jgi:hypothetical protein